jgi:hypothetical protein
MLIQSRDLADLWQREVDFVAQCGRQTAKPQ